MIWEMNYFKIKIHSLNNILQNYTMTNRVRTLYRQIYFHLASMIGSDERKNRIQEADTTCENKKRVSKRLL